jgi:hypothetical protein
VNAAQVLSMTGIIIVSAAAPANNTMGSEVANLGNGIIPTSEGLSP